MCGAAILIPIWRRRKWRQPRLGAAFSIPIKVEVENGGPSASGRHLGWPHFQFREWGHPRWRPEAEGPPFSTSTLMGIEKAALYYSWAFNTNIQCLWRSLSIFGDPSMSILSCCLGCWLNIQEMKYMVYERNTYEIIQGCLRNVTWVE